MDDTTRWRWGALPPDSTLYRIIDPAAPSYADFFDETESARAYLGEWEFWSAGEAHRVGVFRDSSWARPYVLVSRAFRRRYLSADSLPGLPSFSGAGR